MEDEDESGDDGVGEHGVYDAMLCQGIEIE